MEEEDVSEARKKTQPKKIPIFKPADSPQFQDGDDIYHGDAEPTETIRFLALAVRIRGGSS